jgi:hypothetical protein
MKKSAIDRPIAREELVWVRRDGSEVSVTALTGAPYKIDGIGWACPTELSGVDSQYPDMRGGSSMQAICLAIRLIKTRLGHLLDDNETIYDIDDRTEKWDQARLAVAFAE